MSPKPPRHSVTSSPVSSTWTPPGQVPVGRWAAKKPWSSARTSSKRRVLRPAFADEGVAVHRVAGPHHRVARRRDGVEQRGRASVDRRPPMRVMSVRRPGIRSGFRRSHSATPRRRWSWADLAPDGVVDPGEELDVGAVELAGALAHPDHVGRAVVPVAGERVRARERLLVAEDERLVAGVEVDLVQGRLARGRLRRRHEPQGPVDLRRRSARSVDPRSLARRTPGSKRGPGRGRQNRPW